jgi:small subunit ribosomal protein S3
MITMGYKKIVAQKINEFQIKEYVKKGLNRVGLSDSKLQMTPLGEKIVIDAARPGLIIGRKGQTIKKLTQQLKKRFKLENPQIEITEVTNPNIDANIIAERIANTLERYGSARFKAVGHRVLADVMRSGALGVEVLVSGKVPSSRARRWRFYQGYLKKSGDVALTEVQTAYAAAQLKTGSVGIQVRIMPPIDLPDKITILTEEEVQALAEQKTEEVKPKKKKTRKKATKKKTKETPQETAPTKEAETKVEEPTQEKESTEAKE